MRHGEKANFIIITVFFLFACLLYPIMPELMASHWDPRGIVDGELPRFWGVFLIPSIALVSTLLFSFFGKSDPLEKNIKKFIAYYDHFVTVLISFFFYVYLLTISWNFGFRFDIFLMMIPAMSVLVFYIGLIVEKTKRNYTVGIRTPWTLADDYTWEKTHKLGGRMFKATAVVLLFGIFSPDLAIWFLIYPLIIIGIVLFFYSHKIYVESKAKR